MELKLILLVAFLSSMLSLQVTGRSPVRKRCFRPCKSIYRPVCGSNGRTYSNVCTFQAARCRSNGKITASPGMCKRMCPLCAMDDIRCKPTERIVSYKVKGWRSPRCSCTRRKCVPKVGRRPRVHITLKVIDVHSHGYRNGGFSYARFGYRLPRTVFRLGMSPWHIGMNPWNNMDPLTGMRPQFRNLKIIPQNCYLTRCRNPADRSRFYIIRNRALVDRSYRQQLSTPRMLIFDVRRRSTFRFAHCYTRVCRKSQLGNPCYFYGRSLVRGRRGRDEEKSDEYLAKKMKRDAVYSVAKIGRERRK